MNRKLFTLRYSHSQKAFHTSTLESAINDGLNSIRGHRKEPSDWILVGVSHDRTAVDDLYNQLRNELAGEVNIPEQLPSVE